jgi:hypothetical protein
MNLLKRDGIIGIPNHENNYFVIDVFKGNRVGGIEPNRPLGNPIYLRFQMLGYATKNKKS